MKMKCGLARLLAAPEMGGCKRGCTRLTSHLVATSEQDAEYDVRTNVPSSAWNEHALLDHIDGLAVKRV